MQTFLEWLIHERRQDIVPPEVLSSYEQGFHDALRKLLQRIKDPALRTKIQEMLDCPIRDSQGHCRSFTDYIIGALTRNQIHRSADIEDALAYIYQNLMLDKKVTGAPKSTIFGGFDTERRSNLVGNPLLARFKTSLANAIRNIASGRLSRFATTAGRPQGSIHISPGRSRPGELAGMISAEEIPDRQNSEKGLAELVSDIAALLTRKETEHRLPLNAMFGALIAGEPTAERRRQFGERAISKGKQVIVRTIEDYARESGNSYLLGLLSRIEHPDETPSVKPPKTVPAFSSLKEKDYRSILDLLDRLGRPVGTADLGRFRRRWLEYPPRDPSSGRRNRLEEVLHQMLDDGVLKSIQKGRGALAYAPGPAADQYRRPVAA
jgi:hypothetical protein